jgi:sulfhydrogenase subunit beta (sulfur reductase)
MWTDFAEDGFDLFLAQLKEGYLVRVGTSRGDDMVLTVKNLFRPPTDEELDEYKQRSNEIAKKFTRSISTTDLPEILEMEYDSPHWKELGEKCLGCGACSMVCPTCYCFNVADEIALGTEGGVRKRAWDSCLFEDYALVAGGHNFRQDRASRVKLRYLHKQKGFVDQYGRPSCVGCGRCINVCPAKIDVTEVINTIRGAVK